MNNDFTVVRENDGVERLPPNYVLAKRVRELEDRVQDLHTDKKWLHERARELDGKMRELEVKLAARDYDIETMRADMLALRNELERFSLPVGQPGRRCGGTY